MVFGDALIGVEARFNELEKSQLAAIAGVAAGFTALLSLFNIGGRFFWGSLSDKLGRKLTYVVFFVLGGLLHASVPGSAAAGSKLLFVAASVAVEAPVAAAAVEAVAEATSPAPAEPPAVATANRSPSSDTVAVSLAWLAVGVPLAWGVYKTLQSVGKFFQ